MNGRSSHAARMRSAIRLLLAWACVAVATTGAGGDTASAGVSAQAANDCVSFVNCATLSIDFGGSGRGTVVSAPEGIDCTVTAGVESGSCVATFSWAKAQELQRVALVLTPDPGSAYCNGDFCIELAATGFHDLRNGQDVSAEASFRLTKRTLSISRSGAGTGRVTSDPAGISCGSDCEQGFDYGTTVTLTASPDAGAVFKAWTGACAGKGPVCAVQLTQKTSANAVFELPSTSPSPPAPPPSPQPPPSPPTSGPAPRVSDGFVDADVGAAVAGRTRLGARAVRVELSADEPLTPALQLRRSGKTLASKRYGRVGRGERVLMILVPRTVTPGPATLRIVLVDLAGNSKGARRQVTIGGRSTRPTTAQIGRRRP